MTSNKLTIKELSNKLRSKEVSATEVAKSYLDEIKNADQKIGAYITVTQDEALEQAKAVDQKIKNGEELSPLEGIPYALKDNICSKDVKTTCGSKILKDFVPPYDAFVTERLKQQGSVLLGKLNMDEFGMGSSCENSAFKPVKNPRDMSRVPGGSSGGSAAAVASNMAAFTLGSDTGGSIRQPSGFCGIVGLKPTYGTVSRNGLVAFASSLDQIGPLTKCVEDNALVLNALVAKDQGEATSIKHPTTDFTADLKLSANGMKLAVAKEYFGEGISKEVKDGVLKAIKEYEKLGVKVEEVSLPSMKYALAAYYLVSSAEASSNLSRFDGIRYGTRAENFSNLEQLYLKTRSEGFGSEVKRRIMLGSFALSSGYYDAYYKKALQVRTIIINEYNKIFENFDALISPVAPTTAYKFGAKTDDPLEMYLGDVYTVPVNIAGLPALSMPCFEDSEGLPIGFQLIGPALSEKSLYRLGYAFEQQNGIYHINKQG